MYDLVIKNRYNLTLLAAWFMLNIADLLLTIAVINAGGYEANIVLASMSPGMIIVTKVVLSLALGVYLIYRDKILWLKIASVLWGLIVLWNTTALVIRLT